MSYEDDWISSDVSSVYSEHNLPVTFRHVTTLSGPNAARNPVDGTITVATSASAGASTITLAVPVGNWFIDAGDAFSIGETTYTVGARVVAASGKFTNVPISPVLAADVPAGDSVSMTWAGDYTGSAIVSNYDAKMIDGTIIKASDLQVFLLPEATDGRTIPTPTTVDRLIVAGAIRSVGIVGKQYVGSVAVSWEIQAKG